MSKNTSTSSRTPSSSAPKPTKREARESARARLAAERARQKQVAARNRRIKITGGVAAAVLVAVGITVAVTTAGGTSSAAGGPLTIPAHASGTDGTVIVYGKPDAPHTLDVWEDFRCPVCDRLEKADGATIQKLADDGTYKIQYHMATFLDHNLGGSGSMKALAVAGAALNESTAKFKAFHDVLYANQPDEQTDGFSSLDTLLNLARKVPGLVTPQFTKQVHDQTYAPWAGKVSAAFDKSGVTGTPTLKLDGKLLTVFDHNGNTVSPEQFTAAVQQTIAGK